MPTAFQSPPPIATAHPHSPNKSVPTAHALRRHHTSMPTTPRNPPFMQNLLPALPSIKTLSSLKLALSSPNPPLQAKLHIIFKPHSLFAAPKQFSPTSSFPVHVSYRPAVLPSGAAKPVVQLPASLRGAWCCLSPNHPLCLCHAATLTHSCPLLYSGSRSACVTHKASLVLVQRQCTAEQVLQSERIHAQQSSMRKDAI